MCQKYVKMAHNITINDKLYDDLRSYCHLNGLKISTFCNDCISKALTIAKYGNTPFMNYDEEETHNPYDSTLPYDEELPDFTPADFGIEEEKDESYTSTATNPDVPAVNVTDSKAIQNNAESHTDEPRQKVNKPRKRKLA